MEFNKLSKDLKELKIIDKSLKILDVYYCIDLDKSLQDINLIEKCLETYIIVHFKEYKLNIFKHLENKNVNENKNVDENKNDDIVKSGLFTFNKMYKDLKLKSPNDTWFIYISNGDIKTEYKNVFVLLLNKNPQEKLSFYVISKHQIDIKRNDINTDKINGLKFFKKTIHELFNTTRSITYTNLIEPF